MAKKASVYTKGGDKGQTSLVGGSRISKGEDRINLYGEADELNSHIGVVVSLLKGEATFHQEVQSLKKIQHKIFDLGSNLACEAEKRAEFQLPQISKEDVIFLENEIDRLDENLPPLKKFVLPGGDLSASHLHICRTVCRRLERHLIKFSNVEALPSSSIEYINRLSDFFFILSRYVNLHFGEEEVLWEP